jgi:hypothetical protein
MNETLELKYPFTTANGEKVGKIVIHRLKVKDLKAISREAPNDVIEQELIGVARMCGMIPEDLQEMDAADYQTVRERFRDVMGVA